MSSSKKRYLILGFLFFVNPAFSASPVQSDNTFEELEKIRKERQETYEYLNTLNPFSGEYGKIVAKPTEFSQGSLSRLDSLLSNPVVRGYLKMVSIPALNNGMSAISNHPNRKLLVYIEIGWAVFMLILRSWRQSRAFTWYGRFWVRSWTFCLYWMGAAIAVPLGVFGEPYYQILTGLMQNFFAG